MARPDSIALAATAGEQGLQSILVGGNAVNAYRYHRTTFDLYLLIREREAAKWRSFFERGLICKTGYLNRDRKDRHQGC